WAGPAPAAAEPLHLRAESVYLLLHAINLVLPIAAVRPAAFAPQDEHEHRESKRPPEDEAENRRKQHARVPVKGPIVVTMRAPGTAAAIIGISCISHGSLHQDSGREC